MNASLKSFEDQIDDIRNHIQTLNDLQNHYDDSVSILSHLPVATRDCFNRILSRRNKEKEYEYRANIVSLYGAYEQFIEGIIKEYVNDISTICPTYHDLDEIIRKKYVEKWKSLHTSLLKGHTKYKLSEVDLVDNLNSVLINDSSLLLAECFIPIGGNYRHTVVCQCLTDLGVSDANSSIGKYEPLNTYLSTSFGDVNPDTVINLKINDLVERRNEVAHGGGFNIISNDEFEELLEFVLNYAISLNNTLNNELLRLKWEMQNKKEFQPINVFRNPPVVAFSVYETTINEGGGFLVKWGSDHHPQFSEGRVITLHVEESDGTSQQVDFVDATQASRIISIYNQGGFTVNCHFKFL